MKSLTCFRFSSLLFFFFIFVSMTVYSEAYCTLLLTVVTGTVDEAETDSLITLTLGNSAGKPQIGIYDLKNFGIMPPGHDYFKNGNQDIFRVLAECIEIPAPVCNITVTSDGSGKNPGWFLERVEVNIQEPGVNNPPKVVFGFDQWLANDEPPYELTASRNKCESRTSF